MKTTTYTVIIAGILIVVAGAIAVKAGAFKSGSKSSPTPAMENSPMDMSSNHTAASPAAPNQVNIDNYSFNPTPIRVKVGTTVTWTNNDNVKHNVVTDDGGPAGGPSSALFGKGQSFSFTFTTAGTYKYHCDPHPYMHGVVEVTP